MADPRASAALRFPPAARTPAADPALAALGARLRPARDGDLAFLRRLYGSLRAEEMARVAWPEAARDAFLDSQFALQHQHFTGVFAGADFLVVEQDGAPVGRLYVDWGPPDALIVDIGLLAGRRGQGLGAGLLTWVAQEGRRRGAARATLHVLVENDGARRLYARNGYQVLSRDGAHLLMARPLHAAASS